MSAAAEKAFPLFQADVGNDEGTGEWFEVTQDQVNQFADVTHDHQFIHVDPERAAATPFGGTIAHGFLTLAMLTHLAAGASSGAARPGEVRGHPHGDQLRLQQGALREPGQGRRAHPRPVPSRRTPSSRAT